MTPTPPAKAWFGDGLGPRRMRDGYLVPAGAMMPAVRVAADGEQLVVGRGAHLTGGIQAAGRVTLGRGVHVAGPIAAGGDVILAAGCRVDGPVDAGGRIVVQNSRVPARLTAGADVLVLGDCRVGDVQAAGDIVVVGSPKTGRLEPGGRVASRPW